MVDYFALIAPTIASLAKSTVEERRQVYDRLIKMLETQLRAADPPRSEIDILRERIDLEAAIRRVERRIQVGQISTGTPLNPDALKRVEKQVGPQPPVIQPANLAVPKADRASVAPSAPDGSEQADGNSPVPENAPSVLGEQPTPPPTEPPQPTYAPQSPVYDDPQSRPIQAYSDGEASRRPFTPPAEPHPGPPRRLAGNPTPPTQADARQASAPQAPHAPHGPREPDAGRPIYGQQGGEPRRTASRLADLSAAFRTLPGAPPSRPPIQRPNPQRDNLPPHDSTIVEAGQALSQPIQPRRIREPVGEVPTDTDPTEFLHNQKNDAPNGKRRETVHEPQATDSARPTFSIGARPRASILPTRGSGGWQRMAIISACIVAILGGIAMTAYLLRDDPAEFKTASGKYAATEKPAAEEKIADRLANQTPQQNVTPVKPNAQQSTTQQQGNAVQTGPSPPTPDANGVLTQKAMLVLESPDQSSPVPPINGRVTWKLETLKSVVANASEIGSRATVDIPELGLSAVFVFRRNRDPQSANSHMIEVAFTLADTNTTGKVRDIRVPELRGDEMSRGTPLSGIPVPVTENVFLIGLNALPTEMQKNLELLRSQNWFAMPLRFANGKRGILMFEKGKTGERVIEDAMQAWKAN